MRLSIITPLYNSEKFIEHAIMSVVKQEYSDCELILIDDGSTDNSLQICKKYECDSVRCIHIENGGSARARNIGMSIARGKWIIFLDSDDLLVNGFLCGELSRYLDKCEEKNIDIIYTPKVKMDMMMNAEPVIVYPEKIEHIRNHMPKMEFWASIYFADFLRESKIKFYEYRIEIETAFRFETFLNATNIISNDNLIYYIQRYNPNSVQRTWNWRDLYEIKGKVYHDLYMKYKEDDANGAFLYGMFVKQFHMLQWYITKNGCPEKNRTYVKNLANLFKKSRKISCFSEMSLKRKCIYIFLCVFAPFFDVFNKTYSYRIDIDKIKNSQNNNMDSMGFSLSDIESKLEEISRRYRSCFD